MQSNKAFAGCQAGPRFQIDLGTLTYCIIIIIRRKRYSGKK